MKQKVEILHVTEKLQAAGIESFIMNMYRNIDRSKIQFNFMVMRNENEFYDKEINILGGEKFTIDELSTKNVLFRVLKESRQLYKFLKSNEVDTIHVHSTTPLRVFYLIAAKFAGVEKRIYHSHSAEIIGKDKLKVIMFKLLKLLFPLFATHYFACSIAAARWMYPKKIIRNESFTVIYNGIDIEKFKYDEKIRNRYRREFNLEDKFVVGHTGRFLEQKNHKFIVEVFEEIHKKNPNSVLLLIGTGPLEASIKKLVNDKMLGDSILFMHVRSDVNDILKAMDCYIMPSFYEGLPVAAVEAQCSGLPCYFSDNITDEIAMSDDAEFLSLNSHQSEWSKKILNLNLKKRSKGYINVCNKGYDIKDSVKLLSDFYYG